MIFENVRYFFLAIILIKSYPVYTQTASKDQSSPLYDYQIIITEIMADPDPPVQLPCHEFIEIYNKGESSVDLTGWTIRIGQYSKTMGSFVIPGASYCIMCDADADTFFSDYGITLPLENFPPILNSGQIIAMMNPDGKVMHAVHFSNDWFKDSKKSNGGWSLEMIDPLNPCGETSNWRASEDVRGGTPGLQNSVKANNRDVVSPFLMYANLATDSAVILCFSEAMHPSDAEDCSNYSVNHGYLQPESILMTDMESKKVRLQYHDAFAWSNTYRVTVLDKVHDCAGNPLSGKVFSDFAYAELPGAKDIVMNEILYKSSENEFIELYNRSERVINLSSLHLSLADESHQIKKKMDFMDFPFLIFPGSYLVIAGRFSSFEATNIIRHPLLFRLPDTGAILVLSDTLDHLIDEVTYLPSMHSPALLTDENISLERINPDLPSDDLTNWYSASSQAGYATPGLVNSQKEGVADGIHLEIYPVTFSPDNDGYEDQTVIRLTTENPGWICNLGIFNVNGRLIKTIYRNELIGTENYVHWDGTDLEGRLLPAGHYIVLCEMYNPQGKRKIFKKVITLIRKYNG